MSEKKIPPALVKKDKDRHDVIKDARKAATPSAFDVCPPKWGLTPHEYASTARRAASRVPAGAAVWSALGSFAFFWCLAFSRPVGPADSTDYSTELTTMWIAAAFTAVTALIAVAAKVRAEVTLRQFAKMPLSQTVDLRKATPSEVATVVQALTKVPAVTSRKASPVQQTQRRSALTEAHEEALKARDVMAKRIEEGHAATRARTEAERVTKAREELALATKTWPPTQDAAPATPAAPTETLASRWRNAVRRYEGVVEEWGVIASDPLSALEHSSLLDVSRPKTGAFIEALGRAQDRYAVLGEEVPASSVDISEFEDLSRQVDLAWREAKRFAAHVGFEWLPEADRKRAERAVKFLVKAADESESIHVRASAAEQAAKALRQIHSLILPEPSLEIIAAQSRLALTAGTSEAEALLVEGHEAALQRETA